MTDRVSAEIYEVQFFKVDFHPIRECIFGFSFLTTLNIYKDYFKSRKRMQVAQEHNSTSVKKSVTGNLVFPSSSFS